MEKISLLITCMIFTFTVFLSGCTNTEIKRTETLNDETKEIQEKVEKFINSDSYGKFSGSVLLAKNEQILFEKAYGMADYDNKIPNTLQTIFEVGSVTKQFTATAILMLKEKGLLDIQDTLDKYIPDYPNGNKIKIYNLLNHTSGIPEYLSFVQRADAIAGNHTYSQRELIELFKDKLLDFDPGTKFEYSNSNYILLGLIIEKASGISYEDYIKNNIFTPLKMEHTGTLNQRDAVQGMAAGYLKIDTESVTKEFTIEPSLPYAAGEIYSTVGDLLIWNNNLCSGKLINKSSLKEMFTPYMGDYGYGWFMSKVNEENIVYHSGSIPGYMAYISRNIDNGYVAIVLSNKDHDEYSHYIGELLLRIASGR